LTVALLENPINKYWKPESGETAPLTPAYNLVSSTEFYLRGTIFLHRSGITAPKETSPKNPYNDLDSLKKPQSQHDVDQFNSRIACFLQRGLCRVYKKSAITRNLGNSGYTGLYLICNVRHPRLTTSDSQPSSLGTQRNLVRITQPLTQPLFERGEGSGINILARHTRHTLHSHWPCEANCACTAPGSVPRSPWGKGNRR
jgi:hypothetical protein